MADTDNIQQEQTPETPQEETVEEPVEETPTKEEALENSKNPERTKEYIEKLEGEKKKYKDLLSSLRPDTKVPQQAQQYQNPVNRAPSASQFENLNQQQVDDVFKGMVDQDGYVDGNKFMQTLKSMDERTRQAEERAQRAEKGLYDMRRTQEEFEVTSTMKAVHDKFPALDPDSESFDESYYNLVRNQMIGNLMEKGTEDPMGAAQKWYNDYYKDKDMGKKEDAQRKEAENVKKQVNSVRPRSSNQSNSFKDAEEAALMQGVRTGTKGSLAEMLRRRGQ